MSQSAITLCEVCGVWTSAKLGICARTKECKAAQTRRRREVNPDAARKGYRRTYAANPEAARERQRRYRERHHDEILTRAREQDRLRYKANPELKKVSERRSRLSIRQRVLAHYSPTSSPCCACCGTTEKLSIDHINGDGAEHRRELNTSGIRIYRWLIRENFPLGYQVLCMSCNASKSSGPSCRLHVAPRTLGPLQFMPRGLE